MTPKGEHTLMDADTETYHFRIDDADPFGGVLEAIQFVKGQDALELEPIGRVVDPDALDTLVSRSSGVSVSFTVDDLDVEVTAAGDIYVADTTPGAFIHESIGEASNVLLTTHSHSHEACVDLPLHRAVRSGESAGGCCTRSRSSDASPPGNSTWTNDRRRHRRDQPGDFPGRRPPRPPGER